ncbi:MAG: formyl transferase [Planctomycetota bacterium]
MRILILTHSAERHFYFANQLIKRTGSVIGIITGGKQRPPVSKWEQIKTAARKGELWTVARNKALDLLNRRPLRQLLAEKDAAELEMFGGSKAEFEDRYTDLHLASVDPSIGSLNSDHYVSLIRDARPDAIAVMGTCLIGKRIIESAPNVINIHTGLSPYYRGGMTNFWPFVEGDHGHFGVTIHRMSLGIDSGDIVYSQRIDVEQGDHFGTINCRAIQIGAELMADALQRLASGEKLSAVPQWVAGKLFHNRHMNGSAAAKYFKVKDAFIEESLQLAAEDRLPDLRLVLPG